MEEGVVMVLCTVFCGLSALCSLACLIVMLASCKVEGEENGRSRTPAPTDPIDLNKSSGEWSEATFSRGGKQGYDKHHLKATPDDVEKRRRQAVQAKEHQNFMDYDGTPQNPIDPNTILGE